MRLYDPFPVVAAALIALFFSSCGKEEDPVPKTITDIDGNIYHTVRIGDQVWLKENLRVTRFRNGKPIMYITDSMEWQLTDSAAMSFYDHDPALAAVYGNLYNWNAVTDTCGICPDGWHVPRQSDWEALFDHLETNIGGKMKEAGFDHWQSPNTGADNASGFTALPSGMRLGDGHFTMLGTHAVFWSSTFTVYPWIEAYICTLSNQHENVEYNHNAMEEWGLAVRCIKDQ